MRNEPRRYEDRNCPRDRRDIGEKKKKKNSRTSLVIVNFRRQNREARQESWLVRAPPTPPTPSQNTFVRDYVKTRIISAGTGMI